MGRFPHLDDTKFPDLANVDVYRYKNTFDYNRWEANTKIRLVNTLFNSDYQDVVKFDSDEERDRYFDSLEGYAQTLTTAFQVAPNDTVKLPIPYGVMVRYNYLYIDLPMYTSEAQPIDYEDERRTRRYYYFIENVRQLAPSTCEVTVALDQWTTYINDVDITFMMLERGHAPMKAVSVEDYLSNPIANSRYLLAADCNYSNESVVSDSRFVPFGNGKKYVLIASTASAGLLSSFGEATEAQPTSAATYSDASGRDGYRINVNDYVFGQGGLDFSSCALQTDPYASQNDTVPNNVTVCAIEAEKVNDLLTALATRVPHFMRTLQGLFMLSDDLFELNNPYKLAGFTVYSVRPINGTREYVNLDKQMFGYPKEYADIAKLYTYPYSYVEVTDNNGNAFDMRIEQSGNVALHQNVSLAFPYLKIQAFLTGVNGESYDAYTWTNLAGSTVSRQMWGDDFSSFLVDWDIPVYACYTRGWDDYRLANWAQNQLTRENAVTAYQNAARSANTGYANAVDSAETGYANAVRSANTGKANADAGADTGKANADASADTSVANTTNSSNNSITNTAISVASNTATIARSNEASTEITNIGNATAQAAQAYDAGLQRGVQEADAQAVAATTLTNAIGGLAGSVASGAISGAVAGPAGAAVGAVTGAVGGVISGVTSGVNAAVMLNAASTKVELSITNSQDKTTSQSESNTSVNDTSTLAQTDNNVTASEALTQQVANNAQTANTNATNSATTAQANATRTQTTTKENATRTQSTATSNADATRGTTESNADYSRDASVENAQQGMTVAQRTATRTYQTHRNDAPIQRGSYSGDATLDLFERRGVQFKVRTQRECDIAQAGDMMLRFGYALNQNWDVEASGLKIMKHFTYWKAKDVWVNDGSGVTNTAQHAIQIILERGVTVWNDPDEIGKVGIYGNL